MTSEKRKKPQEILRKDKKNQLKRGPTKFNMVSVIKRESFYDQLNKEVRFGQY